MSVHPLTLFTACGKAAPYSTQQPDYDFRATVVPARCKTGLTAARRGSLAHLDNGLAVMFAGDLVQMGGRFLCGDNSHDVVILTAPGSLDPCPRCQDIADGPYVYRCFNAVADLLYIGSTVGLAGRIASHERETPWWPEVADVRDERFASLPEARAAERRAIRTENPLYNKRRMRSFQPQEDLLLAAMRAD
jgi:hypothetical protein